MLSADRFALRSDIVTKLGKIVLPIFAVLIVLAAAYCFLAARSQDYIEFAQSINASGWEDKITYSMLSDELKEIVSEEEFADDTPEARIAMYRKLEELVLDDSEHFYCSTSWWKTPCFEAYTIDGVTYYVEIEMDFNKLPGGIEVANFTCHIQE